MVIGGPKFRVMLKINHMINVRREDISRLARLDTARDRLEKLLEGEAVDRHSEKFHRSQAIARAIGL